MIIQELFMYLCLPKFQGDKKYYLKVAKTVLRSWPLNFYKSVIALNQSHPPPSACHLKC